MALSENSSVPEIAISIADQLLVVRGHGWDLLQGWWAVRTPQPLTLLFFDDKLLKMIHPINHELTRTLALDVRLTL